jgi:ribulose-phosphate 3-epimerase
MHRVEAFSERWHLDVADGHYVPNLLFFPALVEALRPQSTLPFEVHLMTTDAEPWIESFAEAGADVFIFSYDTLADPVRVLEAAKAKGKEVGVALRIEESVEVLDALWPLLDVVTIIGTELGIKGATMDKGVPDKIRQAKEIINQRGLSTLVQADGGIRRETVPLLVAAGADYIVPGSLMFNEDAAEMREWLATL